MRRLMLTAGVVCAVAALTDFAGAQVNTMPGQVVGSGYSTQSVGQPLPKAAPPAGQPIGLPADSAMMRRYDPNRPYDALKGTNLSRDQVRAPIAGMGDQSMWSQLKVIFGLSKPPVQMAPQNSTYFPSLTRRNRERAEAREWRRD
ncbi:MAG: hypothetical protein C0467_21385 [Planctomycetaceae bacterium]|nr:hypothetical protein [Planctomycetaceae bacterium]